MQKRSRKPRQPRDVNQAAHEMMLRSTKGSDSTPPDLTRAEVLRFMRAMGSKGGKKGGKNRWNGVSAEERSKIALKAARARWGKQKAKDGDGGGI